MSKSYPEIIRWLEGLLPSLIQDATDRARQTIDAVDFEQEFYEAQVEISQLVDIGMELIEVCDRPDIEAERLVEELRSYYS